MKTALSMLAGLAMVLMLSLVVTAEEKEKKEVTLKGDITCAKCTLKVEGQDTCATVIKVKEGDKDVIYLFIDEGKKEPYHKEFCTTKGGKKGSVTGVVSEKDGKKYIKPEKDGVKFE